MSVGFRSVMSVVLKLTLYAAKKNGIRKKEKVASPHLSHLVTNFS